LSEPDWSKGRDRVLAYLRAKNATRSDYMNNLPFLTFQDPETMEEIRVSPNDAVIEVNNLSEIGKKIIVATLKNMDRLQTT